MTEMEMNDHIGGRLSHIYFNHEKRSLLQGWWTIGSWSWEWISKKNHWISCEWTIGPLLPCTSCCILYDYLLQRGWPFLPGSDPDFLYGYCCVLTAIILNGTLRSLVQHSGNSQMALSVSTHVKHSWFHLVWLYISNGYIIQPCFQNCRLFHLAMHPIFHHTEELYICHCLFQIAWCYYIGCIIYLLLAASDVMLSCLLILFTFDWSILLLLRCLWSSFSSLKVILLFYDAALRLHSLGCNV